MRKYVIIALVLVLTLTLMAGCRGNNSGETSGPSDSDATILPTDMMPDPTNGNATDGDGFIGEGNGNTGDSGMENRGIPGHMPICW